MKPKLLVAASLLTGSLIMVLAATKVETCDDKFTTCSDLCTNQQAHCKATGSDPSNCENRFKVCMNACDKAKQDCEKNAPKTSPKAGSKK